MSGADRLAEAHAAVERGVWQLALDVLADAGPVAGSAEGLELRAHAAYGNGEFEASVAAWEDLYWLQVAEGNRTKAARAAAMIALYLMMDTGLMAPVAPARRPVAGRTRRSSALAVIAMVRTYERFMCGDMVAALQQSALAIDLGERLGVEPAVVIGRVAAARIRIFDGHVDEGLERLDEIGVLLMSGKVDPLTTGIPARPTGGNPLAHVTSTTSSEVERRVGPGSHPQRERLRTSAKGGEASSSALRISATMRCAPTRFEFEYDAVDIPAGVDRTPEPLLAGDRDVGRPNQIV